MPFITLELSLDNAALLLNLMEKCSNTEKPYVNKGEMSLSQYLTRELQTQIDNAVNADTIIGQDTEGYTTVDVAGIPIEI